MAIINTGHPKREECRKNVKSISKLSKISFHIPAFLSLFLWYTVPAHSQWAVEAGASYNIQNGSFRAPCGCTFLDGKGVGFMAAVSYDILSVSEFTIGIQPGFDFKSFTACEVPSDPSNSDQINVQMRYVTFGPYVRYQVHGSGLFFQVTPEAGYLVSNSFQHISHPIPVPAEDVDSSMGDLRDMRYAMKISAGYKFDVFGLKIASIFSADLPLNNIRSDTPLDPFTDVGLHGASGWHVTTIYFSLAVFFKP
ncbi:MAG TPA: hypothetical protein VFH95_01365 [Candidatus Kapabacteria bacterium]|nr:hypothetical protein [Candidatus Kapabacteria bacterium]